MTAAPPRSRLDRPDRMPGVDLARGLAVLGMLAAHLLTIDEFDGSDASTWIDVVNGRSSILFAVLAGVSIAIVSGGTRPVSGERRSLVRRRLAVRAVLLWLIGIALILTGVPVFVILPAYAILFLLALPLLGWGARALWVLASVVLIVMPLLQPAVSEAVAVAGPDVALLLGWHYPFTLWIGFLAVGLAAGRSDLRAVRTQVLLVVVGSVAAVTGYGAAVLFPPPPESGWLVTVWSAAAHSGGLPEAVGSGGFAMAVLGASLLLCRTSLRWVVLPLRAVGSMPLTAYVGQIVFWAVAAALLLGDTGDLLGFRELDPLVPFMVTTLAACTAWALLLGRGPVEALLAWISRRAVPS